MRILVIEDDLTLNEFITKGLREAGHTVESTRDGRQGLLLALTEEFDALVLDRMLPVIGGMEILKGLRAAEKTTPVLILSSLGDVEHRVEGLKAGADDYLTKPFSFQELSARVDGLLRRSQIQVGTSNILQVADLEMDLLKRSVKRGGVAVDIQAREFKLLEYLMRHANQVVTRTMLLEAVWDYHFDPQTNVIDVHVSRLRQKLEGSLGGPLIHTVRGSGYLLGLRD